MKATTRTILLAALLVEGLLVLGFVLWWHWRGFTFQPYPNWSSVKWGIVAALPLLIFNGLLFGPLSKFPQFRSCEKFRDEVIRPLVDQLGTRSALLVSVLAGLGEELFFRGILQSEVGVFWSAVLFSLLHFGFAVVVYPFVALLYVFYGLYFSALMWGTGDLWLLIFAHAFYDFVVIEVLRRYKKAASR